MDSAILKSGYAAGGYYACVGGRDDAETIVALVTVEPYWRASAAPCDHSTCRRHGGWRVTTNCPYETLKNAGQDCNRLVEALYVEEARHD